MDAARTGVPEYRPGERDSEVLWTLDSVVLVYCGLAVARAGAEYPTRGAAGGGGGRALVGVWSIGALPRIRRRTRAAAVCSYGSPSAPLKACWKHWSCSASGNSLYPADTHAGGRLLSSPAGSSHSRMTIARLGPRTPLHPHRAYEPGLCTAESVVTYVHPACCCCRTVNYALTTAADKRNAPTNRVASVLRAVRERERVLSGWSSSGYRT